MAGKDRVYKRFHIKVLRERLNVLRERELEIGKMKSSKPVDICVTTTLASYQIYMKTLLHQFSRKSYFMFYTQMVKTFSEAGPLQLLLFL